MITAIVGDHRVTSVAALERLYEAPNWVARAKETDRIIASYRAFIEASPYITLATSGPNGTDCSPRGDAAGFVRVKDDRTLLIPDRAGNNRIESLRNIIHNPRVALHFLVPGCGESLRVRGSATITADPAVRAAFSVAGTLPRTVIIVAIDSVYFHCAKAIKRSRLWDVSQHVERGRLPSVNGMLAAVQWQRCRDVLVPGRSSPNTKEAAKSEAQDPAVSTEPVG